MRAAFLLVVLALVAGCVSPVAKIESLAATQPQAILPHFELTDEHDHRDAAAHDVKWNVELLGFHPVAQNLSQAGEYNQVWVVGDLAFLGAHHLANGTAGGLAVFDISGDAPVLLSTIETPEITPIDVHATPDAKYVVLAGHREERLALPPAVASQCTGTPRLNLCAPFVPGGVIVIDVSDPAAPKVVDRWHSFPSGAHTAKIVEVGGALHVFLASYGTHYANRMASHVDILKLENGRLLQASKWFSTRPSDNGATERVFTHDIYIEEHPVTHRMLMWVAYWDGGVSIVDVTDPARPTQVASWADFDGATYGNIHFVRPVGTIGERYIVYAAPEFQTSEHAGEAYVIDATDPAAPTLLSKWALPGTPINDENYRFSPHNHDPLGERIVYAHYHGGVWVLNLSVPEEPRVDAYVFPVPPASAGPYTPTRDAPDVWAAVWKHDGTFLASDRGTGLYHYRIVSDAPGTPPYMTLPGLG